MSSIVRSAAKVLLPYDHIKKIPGKLFHLKIPLSYNYWLKLPVQKMNEIVNTVKILQTNTLLIDDIQDNTLFRGKVPTAHCIYGVPLTIAAYMYVDAELLKKIIQLKHPMAPEIYAEQLLDLVRGQGIEAYWRDNYICPTEEEYRDMVVGKTGAVFLLATRLMQLFSDNKTDYTKITELISLYFQIRDDYCNLVNQEALEDFTSSSDLQVGNAFSGDLLELISAEKQAIEHKNVTNNGLKSVIPISVESERACASSHEKITFAEDITEGKFSFPVINALQKQEGQQLLNILKQRTRDINLKMYFVSQLDRLGSLQYTRDTLLRLDQETRQEISDLGGNPIMESVLDELLTWQTPTKT